LSWCRKLASWLIQTNLQVKELHHQFRVRKTFQLSSSPSNLLHTLQPLPSPQKIADVENFHLENNNVHNANDLLDSMAQRPSGSWDGKVSVGIAK
jgi:hypothetical protein